MLPRPLSTLPCISVMILMISSLLVTGQGVTLKGKIKDHDLHKAIPFANLQLEGTADGTSSNEAGDYQLWIAPQHADKHLVVSCIGFKTLKIPVRKLIANSIIVLTQESRRLEEVIIMPDSSLYVFLREAYSSISKNYLHAPYELKGFYRESLKMKQGKYVYFGEAELLLQAGGYQSKDEWGTVKFLKSRTNTFPEIDSLQATAYFGGPFIAIRSDLVKTRHRVLKVDKNTYDYSLESITSFDGKEVWVVGFRSKDAKENGKLFIEKESKSYIRIERNRIYTEDDLDGISLSPQKTLEIWSEWTYKQRHGKWFVQYMGSRRRDYLKRIKKIVTVTAEFNTTSVRTDSIQPIKFEERFDNLGVFSHVPNSLTENFWDGTTTISQDSSLQNQLKPLFSQEERNTLMPDSTAGKVIVNKLSRRAEADKRLLRIAARFGFGIGLQYVPYSPGAAERTLKYPANSGTLQFTQSGSGNDFPLAIKYESTFRINRRWHIFFNGINNLGSSYNYSGQSFGVRYSFLLKKIGKPILFRPEIAYNISNFLIDFPSFDTGSGMTFGGKNFSEKSMSFLVGEKVKSARFSLSIDKKIKGLKWIYISLGFYAFDEHQDVVHLMEKSGFFLFQKTYKMPLSGSGAEFYEQGVLKSNMSTWFENFYAEAGLRFRI